MRWLGLAAIVCSACATSYSDATSHRSLGHGMYIITADGNGFTSRSLISIYMYRRAAEVCSAGFDLIESDRSATISRLSLGTFTFQSGALAIECRTSRGAIAGAEAGALQEPPKVLAGQRPIYCTAAVRDPDVGTCWLAAEKCASARDVAISDGSAHTPCAPAKAAC